MLIQRHTLAIGGRADPAPRGGGIDGIRVANADPLGAAQAIEAIVRACREAGVGVAGHLTSEGLRGAIADRPGRIHRAWIAWAGGIDPIGFVCLTRSDAARGVRFSLAWLLVHPRWRRRGVGRQLVDQALIAAHRDGAREVHVETRADWPDAAGFWSRLAADLAGPPPAR